MTHELQTAFETKNFSPQQVEAVMAMLDNGQLRVAQKQDTTWHVNTWVKDAVLAYFGHCQITDVPGDTLMPFRDKISLKSQFGNVRIVPGGTTIRYGSHLGDGVVVMPPSYVNIGAYVGAGTMIDSHVLVGSCAQIGEHVHLSAAVQIGGVLEPAKAQPVIIEDNAFIGAGSVIVEGILVRSGAIIAAGVTISASTPIIELTVDGTEKNRFHGEVPANAIVIPGARPKGDFMYQTPLIIGYRNADTDAKVALNEALRDF
jgi:2,3,4,5-tetrahydropyridine-2-carboxylate N-succinyltransferase